MPGDMDRVDLGAGHAYTWLVGDAERYPTGDARLLRWRGQDETLVGIIEWHAKPNGESCGGMVPFVLAPGENDRPVWRVESLDPLHIEPSVLCSPAKGGCGSHGFIRGGRWVAA